MKRLRITVPALVLAVALTVPTAIPVLAADPDPDPGLIGLWRLDGNANDSSVNDFDGTVNGTPAWVADQWGWHAPTKDTTSYVRVKDSLASGAGG